MPLPGPGFERRFVTFRNLAQNGDIAWNLVALGDSTPASYGVDEGQSYVHVFASHIENDLGVTVHIHNHATNSARSVADWVEEIRSGDDLRQDLREADVITLWLGWHNIIPELGIPRGGACYPSSQNVDLACLSAVTDGMRQAFDALLAEIVSLASPGETLIHIADIGIPPRLLESWIEDGTDDVLREHAYRGVARGNRTGGEHIQAAPCPDLGNACRHRRERDHRESLYAARRAAFQ